MGAGRIRQSFKGVANGIEPLLTQAIGTEAFALLPFRRATTTLRDIITLSLYNIYRRCQDEQ